MYERGDIIRSCIRPSHIQLLIQGYELTTELWNQRQTQVPSLEWDLCTAVESARAPYRGQTQSLT